MKLNKTTVLLFLLMIIVGSVCRIMGFAPQIAMAVFGAIVIRDKKFAFALPLISMFLSDVLFEVLYRNGLADYGGFYEGQVTNYLLFAFITLISFWARGNNWLKIVSAVVTAPVIYFLLSNFLVWINGGGLQRSKTFNGLMMCYADAVPFFRAGLVNTLVFSALFFGIYYIVAKKNLSGQLA